MTEKTKIDSHVGATHDTSSGALPRAVRVLLVARFVNRLGAFSMPFLAVLLVTEHGTSPAVAGLIVGGFGLATIPSRLFGGVLATWFGPRCAVLIGLVATSAAQLVIAAAPTWHVAAVGAVLLGLSFEVYEPASQGLIADVTPVQLQPKAYGLLGAALAAAGLAAGLIAAAVGHAGLRWLFVVDAATGLACAVLVRALLPRVARSTRQPGALASPWRDRRLGLLMVSGTAFATVYLQIPMALPLSLSAIGTDPSAAGLVAALMAGVIIVSQPLLRGGDPARRVVLGYALIATGLAIAGVAGSLSGYVVAAVIIAVGDVFLLGHAYALVASLAPVGAKAAYFAVYGLTWGIALAVGPPLMGLLLGLGPATLWLTLAALMALTGFGQHHISRLLTRASADA